MDTSTVVCLDHGADGLDGGIEPPGDLLVGGFQRAGSRRDGVEVRRQIAIRAQTPAVVRKAPRMR